MKDLNRYNNIQELKAGSKPAEPASIESTERHERFADALRVLRSEYLQSRASSDTDEAASNEEYGLQ